MKCREQMRVFGYFSGPRSSLWILANHKSRRLLVRWVMTDVRRKKLIHWPARPVRTTEKRRRNGPSRTKIIQTVRSHTLLVSQHGRSGSCDSLAIYGLAQHRPNSRLHFSMVTSPLKNGGENRVCAARD